MFVDDKAAFPRVNRKNCFWTLLEQNPKFGRWTDLMHCVAHYHRSACSSTVFDRSTEIGGYMYLTHKLLGESLVERFIKYSQLGPFLNPTTFSWLIYMPSNIWRSSVLLCYPPVEWVDFRPLLSGCGFSGMRRIISNIFCQRTHFGFSKSTTIAGATENTLDITPVTVCRTVLSFTGIGGGTACSVLSRNV